MINDSLTKVPFDLLDNCTILRPFHHIHSDAIGAKSARSPNSVQVGIKVSHPRLVVNRRVPVDDQIDAADIKSARRDVGCHQHTVR